MTDLFRKLNFKGQSPILIAGAPAALTSAVSAMKDETTIHTAPASGTRYGFIMVFGEKAATIRSHVDATRHLIEGDGIYWICYPKGTSRRYSSDINRDSLWKLVEPDGLRPVRQVSIDDDWSALRFRVNVVP